MFFDSDEEDWGDAGGLVSAPAAPAALPLSGSAALPMSDPASDEDWGGAGSLPSESLALVPLEVL